MAGNVTVAFASLDHLPGWLGDMAEPLIVMPFIDPQEARRSAQQLAGRAGRDARLLCVQDVRRVGFIAVANAVFRASRAPYFAYLAQDAFGSRNWLKHGLDTLIEKKGGLLAFNDGKWGGALAAFGMVEREWALGNYVGDLFYPDYRRHYADVELTLIAMQQRKLCFEPISLVVEVDWGKDTQTVSEEDRLLYYRRGQTAFDRKVTNAGLRRLFK
jgi:hypothetical protein